MNAWIELLESLGLLALGVVVVLVLRRVLAVEPRGNEELKADPEQWDRAERVAPENLRAGDLLLRSDGLILRYLRKAETGEYSEREEWLFEPIEDGRAIELHVGIPRDEFHDVRRIENAAPETSKS